MISLLFAFYSIKINGQIYKEFQSPLVYDLGVLSLLFNDIDCKKASIFESGFEQRPMLSAYFKESNQFLALNKASISIINEPNSKVLVDLQFHENVECQQIKIFKNDFEP